MVGQGLGDLRVELGRRAVDDPLARELRRRIVANLERGKGARAFRRMWGTVVVVATNGARQGGIVVGGEELASQTTLTLRFDWGRLMIHEGRVGRPDVTLWGPVESILALGDGPRLPAARFGDLLSTAASSRTLRPLWALGNLVRSRSVRIYGLGVHARFVWRLARLLAADEARSNEPSLDDG
jgi:hypothetical protein